MSLAFQLLLLTHFGDRVVVSCVTSDNGGRFRQFFAWIFTQTANDIRLNENHHLVFPPPAKNSTFNHNNLKFCQSKSSVRIRSRHMLAVFFSLSLLVHIHITFAQQMHRKQKWSIVLNARSLPIQLIQNRHTREIRFCTGGAVNHLVFASVTLTTSRLNHFFMDARRMKYSDRMEIEWLWLLSATYTCFGLAGNRSIFADVIFTSITKMSNYYWMMLISHTHKYTPIRWTLKRNSHIPHTHAVSLLSMHTG